MDRVLSKEEASELLLPYIQANLSEKKSVFIQCSDLKLVVEFPIVLVTTGVVEGGIYVA